MPAVSKKQQKFMGIVRAIQTGDADSKNFTPRVQAVAKDMKKKDVKKFASTKHKGLPMKKEMLDKLKEMVRVELESCGYTHSVSGKKLKSSGGTGPEDRYLKEMSDKSKKIISKLGKKEKEMFSTMVDMMGFDQVMADYKKDKKAFKQALADMSENINEKKKMFPPKKMTPKQAKEYKKFIGYAKMGVEYQIDMSLFESVNESILTKQLSKMINEPDSSIVKFMKKSGLDEASLLDFVEKLTRNSSSLRKKHIQIMKSAIKGDKKSEKFINKTLFGESVNEALTGGDRKVLMVIGKEIKDNILKKHTGVKGQQLMKVISSVFMSMRFTPDNINYKNFKKYFPKKYNDKLLKRLGDKLQGENDSVRQTFFKQLVGESVNEARLDPKQLLQQLGGNKFVAMTGAKNLAVDKSKNELHMKIGRNSKSISHVIIRLTSGDLYDMEFLSIRGSSRKIKSKEKGVYADQLGKMFKKNTGLDVRL